MVTEPFPLAPSYKIHQLGRLILEIRHHFNITQQDLADCIGISRDRVCTMERSLYSRVAPPKMIEILGYLGFDVKVVVPDLVDLAKGHMADYVLTDWFERWERTGEE